MGSIDAWLTLAISLIKGLKGNHIPYKLRDAPAANQHAYISVKLKFTALIRCTTEICPLLC